MAGRVTAGMWVRRIISTIILLVAVAALVMVGVRLYGMVHSKLTGHQEQLASASSNLPVEIRSCGPSDLKVQVVPETAQALVGEGIAAKVTVTGLAEPACEFSTADLDIQLVTGDDVVWSPTKCSDSWARTLLIGKDLSWEQTIKWAGNLYNGCDALENGEGTQLVADPGTYRFQGTLLGTKLSALGSVELSY